MKKIQYGLCVGAFLLGSGCMMDASGDEPLGASSQALEKPTLLALGDSIAFGYNPFAPSYDKPKAFVGYPEVLGESFSVKNAACAGESSSSFLSASAPDNGCRSYKAAYKLHENYGSNATQIDYALSRLQDPTDFPDVITFNISGNDIFLLQQQCGYDPLCFQQGLPGMIGVLANNVATVLGTLRGTGYAGPIVFLNLYAGDYNDPATVGVVYAINNAIATNVLPYFGAIEADGFSAFAIAAGAQSPCDAGLLIPRPDGLGCDVHPTLEGQEVLAGAILDVLAP